MGLPLPEAGVTQTAFPNMFFMCTTGTLSPSTVRRISDWAGPARLVDPRVLTNQVAFAKCESQFLKVPPPSAFSVVLTNHCTFQFSQRLVHDMEYDIPTQYHVLWPNYL